MSGVPEFRVLAGLHKHAKCPVIDGHFVGSDVDADIVLSDVGIAPREAEVRLSELGWALVRSGEDDPPTLRGWNEPVALGEAWVTVALSSSPWIEVADEGQEARRWDSVLEARGEVRSAQGGPTVSVRPSQVERASTRLHEVSKGAELDRRRTQVTVAGGIVLGVFALAALFLVAFLLSNQSVNQNARSIAPAQVLAQVKSVLMRLGMSSTLQVVMSPSGVATVTGWVRDHSQRDTLAQALAQIWPLPALRVSIESEALDAARTALRAFAVKYEVKYRGDGELAIEGIASDAQERLAALEAVQAQAPGMKAMGDGIRLAQDVSAELSESLSRSNLVDVRIGWKSNRLTVKPPVLDAADEDRLVAMLASFNEKYWNVAQLMQPDPAATATSVPFTIRSVIGGPQPYIVLANGTKLLVGGTYEKYRLVAIDPTQIVFDGMRRAVLPR